MNANDVPGAARWFFGLFLHGESGWQVSVNEKGGTRRSFDLTAPTRPDLVLAAQARITLAESAHVHELASSERDEDFGTLYCTVCDLDAAAIPEDDEVVLK